MTKKPKRHAGDWKRAFLETLRNCGIVRVACQQAGIARRVAYRAKERDQKFAAEWADALDEACDLLEAIAQQRAKESSDTLLIFLLKAHRPEKYRERHDVRHSGAVARVQFDWDALAEELDQAEVDSVEKRIAENLSSSIQ
jgi:hypothetical protein